jgi:hypothetical protein
VDAAGSTPVDSADTYVDLILVAVRVRGVRRMAALTDFALPAVAGLRDAS